MRTLARAAARSLVLLCVALALVVVAVAAIGISGTRSAASQGNAIAADELTTAVVTGQLARDIDAAYAAGQAAVLTTDRAERTRLLGTLYTSLLPAVDARLISLEAAARRRLARRTRRHRAVHPAVDRGPRPAQPAHPGRPGRWRAVAQPVG